MVDDVHDIAAYYNSAPEREHGRLERHQLEYDLTWHYLNRYLPPAGCVLEVGAATGRYTLPLAKRGYALTAVDLSPVEIEECRKSLAAASESDSHRLAVSPVQKRPDSTSVSSRPTRRDASTR